ncbi:MAG: hypothetical protein KDC11_03800, partial [Chitinophagaceae bacterium]|nr:hypothetical protein [Chitinophagaceae bacterium]
MKYILTILIIVLYLNSVSAKDTAIHSDTTNHVFFLHNKILEDMPDNPYSNQYGKYEFDAIVNSFSQKGYVVHARIRPENADPDQYSWLVAKSIDSLLKLGVSPRRITIVGTGKGALIAMLASDHIRVKDVKYVIVGGCNKWVSKYFHIDAHGTILSIYERTDHVWNSCDSIMTHSHGVYKYDEIELV